MKPKTASELAAIRTSGKMLATVLDLIERSLRSGISGVDVEQIAAQELKRLGGKPVFKGVNSGIRSIPPFPSIICISVDDAVVHGIPTSVPFTSGQVVGFDFGVEYESMITDAARTFIVDGKPRSAKEERLVKDTARSLNEGIDAVIAGAKTGDIASAVQAVLDASGYGIVRELVGHGVGHDLHEPPEIPNYGFKGSGTALKEHMTIAIEPMATLGEWRVVVDPDGWTIRTRDGSIAAHFEDTVLVTHDGYEILTRL